MLLVFLLLLASQFVLGSSFKIRKEQTEKGMEGQKAPSGASSLEYNQAKCKRDNLILVIAFMGSKGDIFVRQVDKTSLVLAYNVK